MQFMPLTNVNLLAQTLLDISHKVVLSPGWPYQHVNHKRHSYRCNSSRHLAKDPLCSASDKLCNRCQKFGHNFSQVCNSWFLEPPSCNVQHVEASSTPFPSDSSSCDGLSENPANSDTLHVLSLTTPTLLPSPSCVIFFLMLLLYG